MNVNHIIIFSTNKGQEADELVQFGLTEGSNRIHRGQGTRSRKFYFENFFLEIVWVHDKNELLSDVTRPTGLWDRADHINNGSSPFGICLENTEDTKELFEKHVKYHPVYLSEGQSFDIITNESHPFLPWTCRLPPFDGKSLRNEPIQVKLGIKRLTKVTLGIPNQQFQNSFVDLLSSGSNVNFAISRSYTLMLEFDQSMQGGSQQFASLPLSIAF